jgi:myo-inositol 2-dehydrogenase / D-chiro-inositol 1-dehydrogenase
MRASTRSTLRIGLVGCGAIASYAHLRLLDHLPGTDLVGVADPAAEARERAMRLARAPVYKRAEDLLGRDDIDAIVICAPTPLHAELALATAAAGKPFYLEKPIATNAEDARRVVEGAGTVGLATAIGFNRRFHPLYQQAREVLRAGRIGRVRAVAMAFCEPRPAHAMPTWMRRRTTGGGVLLDLASHHIDSLRWLLDDEVDEVAATLSTEESEHDVGRLSLSMRGGAEGQGFFSFRTGFADYLEFVGDRGTLRVDRFRPALELRTSRTRRYGIGRSWIRPSASVATWRLQRPFRRVREVSFRRSLAAFVELALGGPRRGASPEEGLRCLEVVLSAEASAREGRELSQLATT